MRDYIDVTGKNEDEAISKALAQLGLDRDDVSVEVLERAKSGFLGLGACPAKIRVYYGPEEEEEIAPPPPAPKAEETPRPAPAERPEKKERRELHVDEEQVKKAAAEFLGQVFGAMGMEVSLEARFDAGEGELLVMMNGEDMGILIGKRGQTLDSLQYLVSLVVNKDTEGYLRVKLDTENYRERRKETLETLARNISYKVKRTKHPVSLEPMNPYERRIIHSALQNDRYVVTRSEGEDPYRHVVISLKRDSYGDGRRGRYNNSRRDRYPDRNGDRPVRNGERNKDRASGQDTDKVIEKAVEKTVESPAPEIAE